MQKLQEAGNKVPALERRPYLPATIEWAWEAYSALSHHRRRLDAAPMPITVAEVVAYAQLKGLGVEDAEALLEYVQLLDEVYLAHAAEQMKKAREQTAAKHKQRQPSRRRRG